MSRESRGSSPVKKLKRDVVDALASVDEPAFAAALRLTSGAPASYSADGILSLLKTPGAAWATTSVSALLPFSLRTRVAKGIFGDGSGHATFLSMIDPVTGTEVSESVFTKDFEAYAIAEMGQGTELRPQMLHF